MGLGRVAARDAPCTIGPRGAPGAGPGTRVSREQLVPACTLADQAGTVLGADARYS